MRYSSHLFWDGRASSLVAQARSPLLAPMEHGLSDEHAVEALLSSDPDYASSFAHLFGSAPRPISLEEVGEAVAAFEQTLLAADSAFDRYQYGGDSRALSAAALRGLGLFRGRAQCASCHTIGEESALLTDGQFHSSAVQLPSSTLAKLAELAQRISELRNSGNSKSIDALIESDPDAAALGRFVVTLNPKDIGKFKTPSLRNVAVTGPYMHDGSVKSLERAVDLELYSRGEQRYPLELTEDERMDLLQFLNALTSPQATREGRS